MMEKLNHNYYGHSFWFDNSIYGEICMPKLTTLDNRLQDLSESAASILREGLEGKVQSKVLMMFSEIIEREST